MADKKVTDVFKLLHRAPSSPFSFNLPLEKKQQKKHTLIQPVETIDA